MLVLSQRSSSLQFVGFWFLFLECSLFGFGNNLLYLTIMDFHLHINKNTAFSSIRADSSLMSFSGKWTQLTVVNYDPVVQCTHYSSDNQDL